MTGEQTVALSCSPGTRKRHKTRPIAGALAAILLVAPLVASAWPAAAAPPEQPHKRWIVRYKQPQHGLQVSQLARDKGGRVKRQFTSLPGAVVEATDEQARALSRDPRVSDVQPDLPVHATGAWWQPGWALDRIDQRSGSDNYFSAVRSGKGVPVYVLDTGINASHVDFTGRLASGTNTSGDGDMSDGQGHGTHVAGLAAGSRHGVARQATIVPVKVLDRHGEGSTSTVLAGIDWVLSHHANGSRAVVNLSLASDTEDPALEAGVAKLLAEGMTVVAASGNAGLDSCDISPGRMDEVITVGAVATVSGALTRWPDSNHGSCVDLFAPGVEVTSAGIASSTDEAVKSGTSMAAPLVSGVAALVLQGHANWTPAQVQTYLVQHATKGVVRDPLGSPNRFVYSSGMATPGQVERSSTPTITGTAAVGGVLTAAPGSWGSGQVKLSYQWLRVDAAGRLWPIAGATGSSYTVTSANRGSRLQVRVTGRKLDHRAISRYSAATAAVA